VIVDVAEGGDSLAFERVAGAEPAPAGETA